MYSGNQEKATSDQIKSSETTVLCMPSPSRASNEKHLIVFESFSQRYSREVQHYRVDVIAGDANAAAYKYYKKQEYQDLYNSSVAVMLREMQREVNMDRPFETRLQIDCSTNNHSSQLRSTNYPDCCFMALSHAKTDSTQNFEKTLEQHV